MAALMERIQETFRDKKWVFEELQSGQVIRAQFEAHHTRILLHVQAFEPIGAVHVVATSTHRFERFQLCKLAELLMRTSHQLTIGNFEMDWDTRLAIFRVSNLFERERPMPSALLEAMVHAAVAEMDRITPALAAIHAATARQVSKLSVPELMDREEWIPPVNEGFTKL